MNSDGAFDEIAAQLGDGEHAHDLEFDRGFPVGPVGLMILDQMVSNLDASVEEDGWGQPPRVFAVLSGASSIEQLNADGFSVEEASSILGEMYSGQTSPEGPDIVTSILELDVTPFLDRGPDLTDVLWGLTAPDTAGALMLVVEGWVRPTGSDRFPDGQERWQVRRIDAVSCGGHGVSYFRTVADDAGDGSVEEVESDPIHVLLKSALQMPTDPVMSVDQFVTVFIARATVIGSGILMNKTDFPLTAEELPVYWRNFVRTAGYMAALALGIAPSDGRSISEQGSDANRRALEADSADVIPVFDLSLAKSLTWNQALDLPGMMEMVEEDLPSCALKAPDIAAHELLGALIGASVRRRGPIEMPMGVLEVLNEELVAMGLPASD